MRLSPTSRRVLAALLAVALTTTLFAGGVVAQDTATDPDDADLDRLVDLYNDNIDQLPGIARGQFAGETIEVRYGEGDTIATRESGTAWTFVTNDEGRITEYEERGTDEETLRIRTSENTYEAIVTAEDPISEFQSQYDAGNIKVNGVGVTKSVTVEAVKIGVSIGRTLGFL